MNGRNALLFVTLLLIALVLSACKTSSTTETPPTIIGDAPTILTHLDQADIDSGLLTLEDLLEAGELLMIAPFNTLDGAGRPEMTGAGDQRSRREFPENFNRVSAPDSNACSGCHNLPRAGGGGDNVANVFVLAEELDFVNFDGAAGDDFEEHNLLDVGNERNTLGMFGSGFIELLAREMTADLQRIRIEASQEARETGSTVVRELETKGVSFGVIVARPDGSVVTDQVEGVDEDLIIKPFHQKGAVISLREFTVNAMNHHHGMQASERFGNNRDPDHDGVADELTRGDMTAITIFQATLPVPGQVMPTSSEAQSAVQRGRDLFSAVGCAVCHVPELRLDDPVFTEPNPYNPGGNLRLPDVSEPFSVDLTKEGPGPHLTPEADGSVLVPAFTDLKRHQMGDLLNNETQEQAEIPTDEWLTRKLWGFASEPPFLHHGRATLISEAILAHGGEAQESRNLFAALPAEDQATIIEFLKTLQVLPEGTSNLVVDADEITTTRADVETIMLGAMTGILATFVGGGVLAMVWRHRRGLS